MRSKNARKYNVEKILYLASFEEKPLNVDVDELGTDLSDRVKVLVRTGCLEEIDRDDSDIYYRITKKGKIELLKLQIQTRKKLGKTTDLHEFELSQLKELTA